MIGMYKIKSPAELDQEIMKKAKQKKISQRDMMKEYGISTSSLYHYRTGRITEIGLGTYLKFEKMGLPMKKLFK